MSNTLDKETLKKLAKEQNRLLKDPIEGMNRQGALLDKAKQVRKDLAKGKV